MVGGIKDCLCVLMVKLLKTLVNTSEYGQSLEDVNIFLKIYIPE